MDRRSFTRITLGSLALGTGLVASGALAAQAHAWPRVLRRGMTGNDVLELQIRVAGWCSDRANGAGFALDSQFGPGTESAVRRFQSAYGLGVDGVAGSQTFGVLNSLEGANGTKNFSWSEFVTQNCSAHRGTFNGGAAGAGTKENVRRTMYQLEAVRVKVGNVPIWINCGFRCYEYNKQVGGISNSRHLHGLAVDLRKVGGLLNAVRSSGFTFSYDDGYVHCNTRRNERRRRSRSRLRRRAWRRPA